jgi:signal peptidase I
VAEGKLSWWAVVNAALFRPTALFEAVKAGQVNARPFAVYLAPSLLAAAGTGMALADATGRPSAGPALFFTLAQLLFSPLSWFLDVRLTHFAARTLGGLGALSETKAAVGFSAVPSAFGLVPYCGVPAMLWGLVVKIRALRSLHSLKLGRSVVASMASLVALVVVPSAVALVVRSFGIEAFKVPAGSMFPSIEIGDHLFVTKSSYGWSTKTAPTRGDVVVFEYPGREGEERVDYIKRVIGVPGDEITVVSGVPSINGWLVPRCRLGVATVAIDAMSGPEEFEVFVEFLEGRAYLVALDRSRDDGRRGPYRVNAGEYWVLGDNRNNSSDSRAWDGGRGAGVPFQNSRGRARWLWLPPERMGVDLASAPVLPANLSQLVPDLARCLAAAPDLEHTRPPSPSPK